MHFSAPGLDLRVVDLGVHEGDALLDHKLAGHYGCRHVLVHARDACYPVGTPVHRSRGL